MSKISYIKQLIENNQKSIAKRTATGLISLAVLAGSLTACDKIVDSIPKPETNQSTAEQTFEDTTSSTPQETYKVVFSDTYNNAKTKWEKIWFNNKVEWSGKRGFQLKCAPFTFLQQQGVVDVDENGYLFAYGNEDYSNDNCIRTHAFVDETTEDNELYLLVQYASNTVNPKGSNDDAFIASWMLRYDLSDACYKDLLALSGDYKNNLLIQQIDEEYQPKIISQTLIRYDAIKSLDLFDDLPYDGAEQEIITPTSSASNYVEKIDKDNMTITVNFTSKKNPGKIYSYTYNVKESQWWNHAIGKVNKEYLDNLTDEDIMIYKDEFCGKVLQDCELAIWSLSPNEEHKASAQLKYDLTKLLVNTSTIDENFEKYENGRIKYSEVNSLTQNYATTGEYGK